MSRPKEPDATEPERVPPELKAKFIKDGPPDFIESEEGIWYFYP